MVGIAGLCGLAASLARIPRRLPSSAFSHAACSAFRCGRDAVVGVGDGVGLRSRPRSRSSSACAEFKTLKMWFFCRHRAETHDCMRALKTVRRDEYVQKKHCDLQDKKHETTPFFREREKPLRRCVRRPLGFATLTSQKRLIIVYDSHFIIFYILLYSEIKIIELHNLYSVFVMQEMSKQQHAHRSQMGARLKKQVEAY